MNSDMKKCQIPEKWCGVGKMPKRDSSKLGYYYKTGTPYECLKKGIGAGKAMSEKIPPNSVRNIRYIGEIYEKRLALRGIKTLRDLHDHCANPNFQHILQRSFQRKKSLDPRPYNSVIWYLSSLGYKVNFECIKIPD